MNLPINQRKTLEEKLRIYEKPFIDGVLVKKILEKFAPNYRIDTLCSRGLLAPISRGELYLNLLSSENKRLLSTTILAQYGKNKTYAVGGLYLYNQYHFSQQLADRVTVYNTSIRGKRIIAGYKFIFRQVRSSFFRGMESIDTQGYGTYTRMTKERALIELIDEKEGKIEYAQDIYNEIRKGVVSIIKITSLMEKYASKRVQTLVKIFLAAGKI